MNYNKKALKNRQISQNPNKSANPLLHNAACELLGK